jgi:multiple sugar transport system substrate-binding protein
MGPLVSMGPRRQRSRQERQGDPGLAENQDGPGIRQAALFHYGSRGRLMDRHFQQQGFPYFLTNEIYWTANTANTISIYVAASNDPSLKAMAEDIDHAYWPVGPVGRPTEFAGVYPLLALDYTKYPQACKALMAFMMEADQFNPWLEAAQGYASHSLNAYDSNPVWTKDPKRAVYRDASKRTLTLGGLGSIGDKLAAAIAGFVLVDMFASYCTGGEDLKGAIKIAERQFQRIYR